MSGLVLAGAVALQAAGPALPPPVVSTFSADAEGWLVRSDDDIVQAPTWVPEGGNPGGYVEQQDFGAGSWFFEAPEIFLSNACFAFNSVLHFDARTSGASSDNEPDDVVLEGAGLALWYTLEGPRQTWQTFEVPLSAASGWTLAGTPDAPTDAQLQAVLCDLTRLAIRGDWIVGGDIGGMDNVVLTLTCPPADLDGDCTVGASDLAALLAAWGPCPPAPGGGCPADLDFDGAVGASDLAALLADWEG